ncbi:hypothetical protein GCM10027517_02040 [Phycicoccus ginsengisoli]
MTPTRASVVVLGFGDEPELEACLAAIAEGIDDSDELVLVDNGVTNPPLLDRTLPAVTRVVGTGSNTGFAGGCELGAAEASGEVLVFVNSDAVVRQGAVDALVQAASDPGAGIVGGCLVLAEEPTTVNSVGNPLSFLGVTWAGSHGDPVADHRQGGPVAVATGGLFALRRGLWDQLGGFDETYFAYHEDTDLSLRAWLVGSRVEFLPLAVAEHHYEFSRNPSKMYLIERNRLITLLTDYPSGILRLVLPAVVVTEPAFLLLALLQGWGPQKLRSWWWLATHVAYLRRRRQRVQATVRVPDRLIAQLMQGTISPPMVKAPPGMSLVNAALTRYWRWSKNRLIRG